MFRLPPQYLAGLSAAGKREQAELIAKSKADYARTGKVENRPRVSDSSTPRSSHVIKFERRYGFSVTDHAKVRKLFPDTDVTKILAKGAAAYGSAGSRPNVSIAQWTNARLASVLTGGKALKVDKDLVGPISEAKIKRR